MDKREEIIELAKNFFKEKAKHFYLDMAFLYGSWSRGFPRQDSDIDIAIVFAKEPPSEDEVFNIITAISLDLTKRTGLEVNVIPIYQDFQKPMLYYNAIVLGLPIFVSNPDRYIDLRNEAIHQMEDFSIFGVGWQLAVAESNLEELTHA